MLTMADPHRLIREYIKAFNERRFEVAALMRPEGYVRSARMATGTFPDLRLEALNIEERGDSIFEFDPAATRTQAGDWDAGPVGTLKASGLTYVQDLIG